MTQINHIDAEAARTVEVSIEGKAPTLPELLAIMDERLRQVMGDKSGQVEMIMNANASYIDLDAETPLLFARRHYKIIFDPEGTE